MGLNLLGYDVLGKMSLFFEQRNTQLVEELQQGKRAFSNREKAQRLRGVYSGKARLPRFAMGLVI